MKMDFFWGMIAFWVAGGAYVMAITAFVKSRALEKEIKQIKTQLASRA